MLGRNSQLQVRLDDYYQRVKTIILSRQSPITGLLPASTAVTAHGDYTDAWVRDNVYSILAVWGLALAYRKIDDHQGRRFELEHSVVKLMRGLLMSMMRQADKVEQFKQNQSLLDAMHAKYETHTGNVAVGDDEWGHLQLDATSLFLLILAQMTASGLSIIFSLDEVNFVQNLVYYIGRTYRTPDYGIWERGNKINHGHAELNASSVGMAKAALEAMSGLDLFGMHGSQASVIHVLRDEVARSRITLESLLPRESNSKEIDAALLSVISFPAFAVETVELVDLTRQEIVTKLQGRYGCKRFLRDGHQSVLEDSGRLHYEPFELKQFEHIESEWPLFFTYLFLDGLFRGDRDQASAYRSRLEPLLIEQDGWRLLPELYYVPAEKVEAERAAPHSQSRVANQNVPLVWAQSLFILAELLAEDLLAVGEIDPLGRHLRIGRQRHPLVQIALLAENEALQARLAAAGIATQTLEQIEPIQVRSAQALAKIYSQLGRNNSLGLTGRPLRRLRSLTTSSIFQISGQTTVFLPSFLDPGQFYLTLDYHFLVDHLKSELAYVQSHWDHLGRPTLTILITTVMLDTGSEPLLELIQALKSGYCNHVQVKLGPLNQLMLTAGSERIDFWSDLDTSTALKDVPATPEYLEFDPAQSWPLNYTQEFALESETDVQRLLSNLRCCKNLYEQIELLQTLWRIQGADFDTGWGPDHPVTLADLVDQVYDRAGQAQLWAIVRRAAGLRHKVDIGLSDAVTKILVRQKQISVGKSFSEGALITRPMSHFEVMDKISEFCGEDIRDRVLTQEILIYLGLLMQAEPDLFEGLLTLRVGYFILLITSELARELKLTQDEAYERLMQLSPFETKQRLRQVLVGYEALNQGLFQQEFLHLHKKAQPIDWIVQPQNDEADHAEGWWRMRQQQGTVNRVPKNFYPRVWKLLNHCQGLIIGDKLERRNRLESELLLAEMTPDEPNFALRLEHLLNKIPAPEYRQLNVETLMELAAIAEANADFRVDGYIVLDVLIGHAVRLAYLGQFPQQTAEYNEHKAVAWRSFYHSSPYACASSIVKALRFLTEADTPEASRLADEAVLPGN